MPDVRSAGPEIYNENAFRYFVVHERKRSRSAGRPFIMVLVDVDDGSPNGSAMPGRIARALFVHLSRSLRETDIVGWYREGRSIGAVLTDVLEPLSPDFQRRIAERVGALLRADGALRATAAFRVRMFQQPALSVGGRSSPVS